MNTTNVPTQEVGIDPTKSSGIVCKCGNHTFQQVAFLRKMSALLSPTGKDISFPVVTFACNSCGDVPSELVPPFIKDEAAKQQSVVASNIPNLSIVR